jgi:hypothetical protein
MRALRFANTSEELLDQMGVKKTIMPSESQLKIMAQLAQASGVPITQDRRILAQVLGPKGTHKCAGAYVWPDRAWVTPFERDGITMNCDADSAYWWKVLFHELAHATGAPDRLNRIRDPRTVPVAEYCYEEVIAEMTSRRVMDHLGLGTDDTRKKSNLYIERFLLKADVESMLSPYSSQMSYNDIVSHVNAATSMVLYWIAATDLALTKAKVAA